MYTCPECEGEINQASEICPRCGADLALLAQLALASEPAKPRSLPRLLLIWGAVLAVVAAGLYAFVWQVLPEYSATDAPEQSEARAVDALRALQSALSLYASAEGRYPESLEPLGAPGRSAAGAALRAGYTIQYTRGEADSEGIVRTYALLAQPSRYGLRSYFSDQSGAVHWTRERRAAAKSDPAL